MKGHRWIKKILAGILCGALATTGSFSYGLGQNGAVVQAAITYVNGKVSKIAELNNGILTVKIIDEKSKNSKSENIDGSTIKLRGWYSNKDEISSVIVDAQGTNNEESYCFYGLLNMKSISFAKTQSITGGKGMFEGCTSLEAIDLSMISSNQAVSLKNMFKNCTSLKRVTGLGGLKASDISGMFEGCTSLEYVDFTGMDLSGVTDTSNCFMGCSKLKDVTVPANLGKEIALPANGTWHSEDTIERKSVMSKVSTAKSYSTTKYIPTPTPIPTQNPTPMPTVTPTPSNNAGGGDESENKGTPAPQESNKDFVNTGVYMDKDGSALARASETLLYVNGGNVKQKDNSKIDYKNKVFYTNIEATDLVTTNAKGKTITKKGKVIVGITSSNMEPELVKGKIVDKTASLVAKASISKGKIKVTAQKQSGIVYLWIKDTGDGGESACMQLTVKVAPATLNLYGKMITDEEYTTKLSKYTKDDIQVGSGSSIYLYPFYKVGKTVARAEDATYSISVQEKWASYFTVEADASNPYHFVVYAKGLKDGKKVTAGITITCKENGKKATFKATAVNQVKEIQFMNPSELQFDKKEAIVTITASAIQKNKGTIEVVTKSYKNELMITDVPKLYMMGSADGYDKEKLEQGKIKITEKASKEQKAISAKLEKDKKTVTITINKNPKKETTVYYLLVYNNQEHQGYEVLTITSEAEE